MNNRSKIRSLMAVITMLIGALGALAHPGMEHVMGIITAVTDSTVTVKTVQQKTVIVLIDRSTQFVHNDTASSVKDLHIGDRVVIHAKPNTDKKLVGAIVKWGSSRAERSDHTK